MVFYIKTAGWVMIPLILGVLVGNYVEKSSNSQALFFVSLMMGFGITCYGIYREIKEYKKDLDIESKNKKDGTNSN